MGRTVAHFRIESLSIVLVVDVRGHVGGAALSVNHDVVSRDKSWVKLEREKMRVSNDGARYIY